MVPLLADLCRFSNLTELPPLVQAAVAHAQFEVIHPFVDGNGRTGRALVQVLLRRRKLAPSYVPPISVVLARDRRRYIAGLIAYQDGDLHRWLEQFAVAAAQAAGLAERYLQETRFLQDRWREQLRGSARPPRVDATAWSVIDLLPGYPVVTTSVLTAVTGRSKPSVGQAVDELVGAGVLIALSESSRNRSWEAADLLDLLTGLEG